MAPRVLVSDELSETAVQIFRDRGVEVDFQPKLGKDKEKLAEIIGNYDGCHPLRHQGDGKADRRCHQPQGHRPRRHRRRQCRYSGRLAARYHRHEHAVRQLHHDGRTCHRADVCRCPPAAAGRRLDPGRQVEKSKFMGVEITGKTLGVIGAGNIGGIVCKKAIGLGMHVLAYDPFLSAERAQEMGVTKVELDDLLAQADLSRCMYR